MLFQMLVLFSEADCLCEAGMRVSGRSRFHLYCFLTKEETEFLSASINEENPRGKYGWILLRSNDHLWTDHCG